MKTYLINNIQDIADATNPENLENFIIDLRGILMAYHFSKISMPNIKLTNFTWIDDNKHEITINITSEK